MYYLALFDRVFLDSCKEGFFQFMCQDKELNIKIFLISKPSYMIVNA